MYHATLSRKGGQARSEAKTEANRAKSVAYWNAVRGDDRPGSDVDLIAMFAQNPGLRFFTMEEEMAALLGVPVHLLTRDAVEEMPNPFRQASILAEAQEIYHA